MRGKILASGVISGDDGKRYYYDTNELKNAIYSDKFQNSEVDFELNEDKATGIYIIKNNISKKQNFAFLSEIASWILNPNTIAFAALFAMFAAFMAIISCAINIYFIFDDDFEEFAAFSAFISVMAMFFVSFALSYLNKQSILFKSYIAMIFSLVLFAGFAYFSFMQTMFFNHTNLHFGAILMLICFIATIVSAFIWSNNLAKITKKQGFIYAYIIGALSFVLIALAFFSVVFGLNLHILERITNIFFGRGNSIGDLGIVAFSLALLCVAISTFVWLNSKLGLKSKIQ